MKNLYRILIIEDDKIISKSIANHLKKWDYIVDTIDDFKNIIEKFIQIDPHLILLDISLPFYNGYHWCSEIRRISKVPIIFISSTSENMNIIMAMDMGADDFIVKPFDLSVLVAKINALVRRTYSFSGQIEILEHRGVMLNLENTYVLFQDKEIELTKNEFKIIKILMENKDKVVHRNQLMTKLWESESFIDDNTLTVNIGRLRKKLEEIEVYDFIKTKKGLGYMVD